jgi:hypothetical protein
MSKFIIHQTIRSISLFIKFLICMLTINNNKNNKMW